MADTANEHTPIHAAIAAEQETMHPLPADAPIYDRLRSMALHAFHMEDISYATLQSCLNLAHICEADMLQRSIANVAINRDPDGTLHRG